jgi:hypothetical protein
VIYDFTKHNFQQARNQLLLLLLLLLLFLKLFFIQKQMVLRTGSTLITTGQDRGWVIGT